MYIIIIIFWGGGGGGGCTLIRVSKALMYTANLWRRCSVTFSYSFDRQTMIYCKGDCNRDTKINKFKGNHRTPSRY